MELKFCPNHKGCQIINLEGFIKSNEIKNNYISNYCEAGEEKWSNCKRFQTKKALNFCPDFILPDTNLTLDQIFEKIETQL